MTYHYLKKRVHSAREMHTILREWLIGPLGWSDVDNNPGAGSFGLVASSTSGVVTNSFPRRITSGSNLFTPSMVGQWLVTYNTTIPTNKGVFKIGRYINPTTIECVDGIHGPNFTTEDPVSWRVIDPTLNTGSCWFVVGNSQGTQARFYLTGSLTNIFYEVSPFGGWDTVGNTWTQPATNPAWITEGVNQIWTWFGPDEPGNTHIVGVSDDDYDTVNEIAYVGNLNAFHLTSDTLPAICLGGTPDLTSTGFLGGARGGQIAADNATSVDAIALEFGDGGAPFEFFDSLEPNPWDGFWDEADIVVGALSGVNSEQRGVLYDVRLCSTLLRRRESLNNGRTRLSLGTGISVLSDGSSLG